MKRFSHRRVIAQLRHRALRGLFDIHTHLTDAEKMVLFSLAQAVGKKPGRPRSMVEIGSYLGASSAFLAAGLSSTAGQVLCIDTWNNDAMSEGKRETFAEFQENTQRFSAVIRTIQGWSTDQRVIDEVARNTDGIDLLFIDGDHSYQGALADWEAYEPLLAEDAVVLMHDIGWAEGVQRVVAEHIRPRIVREHRLPNLWCGWIRK